MTTMGRSGPRNGEIAALGGRFSDPIPVVL
jgi:hypothetical protein